MVIKRTAEWPRYLDRELAATYLGVDVDIFNEELAEGMWPGPCKSEDDEPVWDRVQLDAAADHLSEIRKADERHRH